MFSDFFREKLHEIFNGYSPIVWTMNIEIGGEVRAEDEESISYMIK